MRTTILTPAVILCLAAPALAQGPAAPAEKEAPAKPAGIKVLKAVVMEVAGTAQARSAPKAAWKTLAVNDVLEPGAIVRTGRKSHVALRVGRNATVLIERHSRVAIPEIVESGQVLRTRVAMKYGKMDVRVNQVGLRNDFGVATPTATLAVRGTVFRIDWDAIHDLRARGVRGNKLRAIEVRYRNRVLEWLSGADSTGDAHPLPAIDGFFETYLKPLQGAVDPSGEDDNGQGGVDHLNDPARDTGLDAERQQRGSSQRSVIGDPTFNDNPSINRRTG